MITDKQDLEYLGIDFQYRAAKALIEDNALFKNIYKILDQNCFSDPILRKIIGTQKDLYKKNKIVPSYYEISSTLRNAENDDNEIQYIDETIDKIKRTTSEAQYFTEQQLITFFKWKYAILNVNNALEKLKGGYDEKTFNNFIKELRTLDNPQEIGTEAKWTKENIMKVLTEGEGEVIPTGIREVDNMLAGGLGRTEIGLFTALTGYGKTTFGTILANNAAMKGFKVLQIYFEDSYTNVMRKHLTIIGNGVKLSQLKNLTEEAGEKIADRYMASDNLNFLSENLCLLKMMDKQTTVEDIEEKIEYLINNENFRPDMLVIDYFGCLKFSRNAYKDVYAAQADCMRKIVGLANQYNIAVWIMQQNNRPSPEKTAGMGNWQGAYEATQPASVWIELQRTAEQKQHGRGDLIFNKTRNSQPKEDLLDIVFDNGRMLIDCNPEQTERDYIFNFNNDEIE